MQGISGILKSTFNKRSVLSKQVQSGMIVEFVNELIHEYWGKKGAEQAKAKFIKNKILTIFTVNAGMSQEIKFKQNKILETVNTRFDERVLNQLKIVAGGIDKGDDIP
ncbi:MAG: hypothetical protein UT32_C0009G0027 [Parcubacteria group bacterium GW2011_GWC2_39_14]|nr:MAG: hypothetical protein UT32_C0009G0027 [Parcubacteria group bacterium GW2011_GWC2_39_14]KKR55366.1 MAG: hypothetical protein UT91_C0002G0027 [Parcubacteria group bacterium GW2011_GWA2_40_23]